MNLRGQVAWEVLPRRRLRRAKACKSWCEMVHISWEIQLSGNSQKKDSQYGTLMSSKVIHESERAGGMGGAVSRKLRRGGSAESGCHWMVFISLEVQLLGILSILDMSPLGILFLAGTSQLNVSWDVNHLIPRFTCLGPSESSPGSTSHATCPLRFMYDFRVH